MTSSTASSEPPIPRTVYASEYSIAAKLVQAKGEDVVSSAFFDGNLAGLIAAFPSEARWTEFCTKIEAKQWAQAEALL